MKRNLATAQYSTDNQLPMLEATRIDYAFWKDQGKRACERGDRRMSVAHLPIDPRATDAWLTGWDAANTAKLNSSGYHRQRAIMRRLALRKSR